MENENKNGKQNAAANLMQLMSFTADKALEMADSNSVLGDKIEVDGMTIIPVSKISAGFAGGGASITNATIKKSNAPSGSGAKVTVTPMSFLVISQGSATVIDVKVPEKATKDNIINKIIDTVKDLKNKKKTDVTVEVKE